jgi:hypothetical protein
MDVLITEIEVTSPDSLLTTREVATIAQGHRDHPVLMAERASRSAVDQVLSQQRAISANGACAVPC